MTDTEWAIRNNKRKEELLKKWPQNQREKDIWNLKWIMYDIGQHSLWYRLGIISTLRRAIELMEKEIK